MLQVDAPFDWYRKERLTSFFSSMTDRLDHCIHDLFFSFCLLICFEDPPAFKVRIELPFMETLGINLKIKSTNSADLKFELTWNAYKFTW